MRQQNCFITVLHRNPQKEPRLGVGGHVRSVPNTGSLAILGAGGGLNVFNASVGLSMLKCEMSRVDGTSEEDDL